MQDETIRPIDDILANSDETIASLETQKRLRDDLVIRTRGEMLKLHDRLEPLWAAEAAKSAGPAHLRQTFQPHMQIGFGSLTDDKLAELADQLSDELRKRGNRG